MLSPQRAGSSWTMTCAKNIWAMFNAEKHGAHSTLAERALSVPIHYAFSRVQVTRILDALGDWCQP